MVFNDVQDVLINTTATFTDSSGNTFRPVSSTSLTTVELAASRLASTNQYFVDIAVSSESVGLDTNAASGTVSTVTGVLGATRTFNLQDFSGGTNIESNSELYARILKSQTNRELVKKDSINSALLETFPTVRSIVVQGYGDDFMDRDTVRVAVDSSTIFPASFCQKVNLPLTEDGEILWTTTDSPTATALGGFVGAIVDSTGLDFEDIRVLPDGRNEQRICLQQGQYIRFLGGSDLDTAKNDHLISRVETVPIEAGGTSVKILRLDGPLISTDDITSQPELYPYSALGLTNLDDFHVGGKVDVYIDSAGEVTKEVTITSLPAATTGSDVAEIPMISTLLDSAGNSLFENNVGFDENVLYIEKIEQIDAASDEVLLVLTPDTNYSIIRQEERAKFTTATSDLLSIRGTEEILDVVTGESTGVSIPRFIGQRIKITYRTNPDLATIQTYLSSADNRDITKDILVKPPVFKQASVILSYSGTATSDEVVTIVKEYIDSLGFGESLVASDLSTVLAHFNVSQLQMPITLQVRTDVGNGRTTFEESEDIITPSAREILRADSVTATKL